jgi:tetratricopeptide (TPR) repeat protein
MRSDVSRSRMLVRLEAEAQTAPTQLESDCKRGERAVYLARLGRFSEGSMVVDQLRKKYSGRPNVEVTVWLNLAEGLLEYFSNMGVSATDRVRRAHALSTSAGLTKMQAISAAWLAQFDYAALDFDAMLDHVSEALRTADSQHHAALSRANLVVAQALHLARRFDLAQNWYRKSRHHAMAEHDDVTISALLHNMSWLRMSEMRQTVLSGIGPPLSGREVLPIAESNEFFDRLTGDFSWQSLKPILRAQILSLQCNWPDAMRLYSEHFGNANLATRLQANLYADKAWCHIKMGQFEEARVCADQALDSLSDKTQVDERAATHSRLAQVFGTLGKKEESTKHLELASEAWQSYGQLQSHIASVVEYLNFANPEKSDYSNSN